MAFARDPVALYEATTLAWDTWTSECLGAESVNPWRDGVACATGFPGARACELLKGFPLSKYRMHWLYKRFGRCPPTHIWHSVLAIFQYPISTGLRKIMR